jgi:hypothetical protein
MFPRFVRDMTILSYIPSLAVAVKKETQNFFSLKMRVKSYHRTKIKIGQVNLVLNALPDCMDV